MADIRRIKNDNGPDTFQIRYRNEAAKAGYSYKNFKTMKAAKAYLESGEARSKAAPVNKDIVTVAQGLQKWLDVCEKEGRDGGDPVTNYTFKNYKWRRDHILRYGWTKTLPQLTSPDMVEFRTWLVQNFSRDVAGKLLTSFHSMILEMIKRGVLDRDILVGVSIRGGSRYDTPIEIPTVAEVRALLQAANELANSKNKQIKKAFTRYEVMLNVAVDTGMRPQEYIALARSSITDTGIEVSRALERGGKLSVPKTKAGRRFIDASPQTIQMLREYIATHGIENDHDLVFPTSNGTWQSVDNWRKRGFDAICEKAGLVVEKEAVVRGKVVKTLKPKYYPYHLRHFYASMQIERKVNLKRLQSLMGHEKIQTTLNTYGHIIERVEAAAERQTGILGALYS
jgi:integrase